MTAIDRIKQALLAVPGVTGVWHYYAHNRQAPYIIWAEDGQGDAIYGNGHMVNQVITGTVDLFSSDLDDQAIPEAVQTALNGCDCAWRFSSSQYENDTGLKHLEWVWEVVNDGPDER